MASRSIKWRPWFLSGARVRNLELDDSTPALAQGTGLALTTRGGAIYQRNSAGDYGRLNGDFGLQGAPLLRARRAWMARDSRAFNALIIGDSITEGFGVTGFLNRPLHVMRRILQQFANDSNGIGYIPARGGVSTSTLWTYPGVAVDQTDYAWGLGRRSILMNQATETAQLVFDGDRVWVHFHSGPGVGNVAITIDGVTTNTSTFNPSMPSGVSLGGWVWDSGLLTKGPHTLLVAPLNTHPLVPSYNVVLHGATVFNGEGSEPPSMLMAGVGLTNASTNVTATGTNSTNSFRPGDTGKLVYGHGIVAGTTITYVSAAQATLSQAANATVANNNIQIAKRNVPAGQGVRIWDSTQSGYSAAHFGPGATYWEEELWQVQPDICFIAMGTNDESNAQTIPQFQASLAGIETKMIAQLGAGNMPSICLVPMWRGTTRTAQEARDWWWAMVDYAATKGWAVADPATLAGDVSAFSTTDPLFFTMDGLHATNTGARLLGAAMAQPILVGVEHVQQAPRKYVGLVPGSGSGTVNVVHGLGRAKVIASVQRIVVVNAVPIGEVGIRWFPVDANTITIDFDSYARVAGEFEVVVMG